MRFIKLSKRAFRKEEHVKLYFLKALYRKYKGIFYVIGQPKMEGHLEPNEELLWFYEDRLVAIGKSKGELITGEELEESLGGESLNTKEAFEVDWVQYIEDLTTIRIERVQILLAKAFLVTAGTEKVYMPADIPEFKNNKWGFLSKSPITEALWSAITHNVFYIL